LIPLGYRKRDKDVKGKAAGGYSGIDSIPEADKINLDKATAATCLEVSFIKGI
jgi:hypothetical protein